MLLCNMYVLRLFIIPHILRSPKVRSFRNENHLSFAFFVRKNTFLNYEYSEMLEKIA